ncbi:hypothetical protein L3Q82_020621 [Scortum barcoo]|uniref:Uncharacterized protein n=1 Tax=Scortum barcoo TaxID=214431 RepID=A0ACB8V889_9TELE|nr:hypothetical protein L3Q82_020621 [Scortum barcoo]
MEVVFGLLLMLLGVCHGVETSCDGRQDGAQCYGALGGTVVLQLMDSASEIFRYNWINRLSRTDGGEYTLTISDSNGRMTENRSLQLFIEAPVSSVLLVFECLSQGDMRVSCSSEGGDSPQYSWTLDGHTLTDAELLSGNNEAKDIILKQGVSGQLVCSVRNNVSEVSKEGGRYPPAVSEKKSFINCTLCNGTHISLINRLSRTDGGEYTLTISDSNGRRTENRSLQLFIEAPVSSVLLVFECLSQGDMRVSCSSEGGDSPQYSWTLDGHTLTDAELLSGNNEAKDIILKQGVSGQLVCSVRNHMSVRSRKRRRYPPAVSEKKSFINCTLCNGTHISLWVLDASNNLCNEPTNPYMKREDRSLLICGVRAAVVILILIGDSRLFCLEEKEIRVRWRLCCL